MAYPSVSAPYGLIPVGKMGGNANNHAIRHIPIASAQSGNLFNGDLVKLTGGYAVKDSGTTTATPIGVFLGCFYTDADMGPTYKNYWPTGQVASDAVAYVCDDPQQLFKVAIVSGTDSISSTNTLTLAHRGSNGQLVQNAGLTTTGKSKVAVNHTAATTATFPIRFVDFVEETKNSAGGYTEAIVKINAEDHQYEAALGVA